MVVAVVVVGLVVVVVEVVVVVATRNGRVRSGTKGLVRLAGLPGGFDRKVMLIRKSVWKHSLHGAETSVFPTTSAKRLRTKVCRALRIDKAGRSPWLVLMSLPTFRWIRSSSCLSIVFAL